VDVDTLAFKAGDGLYATFACRSVDTLLAFGSQGRVYSVPVAALPGGRGDGQPITSMIELEAGTQILHYFAGAGVCATCCSAAVAATAFWQRWSNLVSRQRAGKAFVSCNAGEDGVRALRWRPRRCHAHVACAVHRWAHPDL
jgi:topoisomerase-4 subunit A